MYGAARIKKENKAESLLKSGRGRAEIYGLLRNFVNADCPVEGDIEENCILQKLDAIIGDIPISRCREYEIVQCENDLNYLDRRLNDEKKEEPVFLENENAERLLDEYLAACKIVTNYILERYLSFLKKDELLPRPWIEEIPNVGFFKGSY